MSPSRERREVISPEPLVIASSLDQTGRKQEAWRRKSGLAQQDAGIPSLLVVFVRTFPLLPVSSAAPRPTKETKRPIDWQQVFSSRLEPATALRVAEESLIDWTRLRH
ncbi:unnamed protein product [Pleuronectes platessa]|uniref:Uncharacterized protein n=1 Tax=Pleuronectes platessa TaxID=8262 RepID=A0A9N7UL80_PLEPL|nr:unnamed protein product [Pleuronectes platessa]